MDQHPISIVTANKYSIAKKLQKFTYNTALSSWHGRCSAALVHLALSAVLASLVAALVFLVWFPANVRGMVGGRELFWLVIGVDLVMGPLLTFVVFSRQKSLAHLSRDLTVIAALQLLALGFGLHTVWLARPVHINFEIDRLWVVTAADIDPNSLKGAPQTLRSLPLWGPLAIASVKPKNPDEQLKSMDLALAGFDLHQQPSTWASFDATQKQALWGKATPLSDLLVRWQKNLPALEKLHGAVLQSGDPKGLASTSLRAIAILSKRVSWTAIVNEHGAIVATLSEDML